MRLLWILLVPKKSIFFIFSRFSSGNRLLDLVLLKFVEMVYLHNIKGHTYCFLFYNLLIPKIPILQLETFSSSIIFLGEEGCGGWWGCVYEFGIFSLKLNNGQTKRPLEMKARNINNIRKFKYSSPIPWFMRKRRHSTKPCRKSRR